jgi:hypothetical protein
LLFSLLERGVPERDDRCYRGIIKPVFMQEPANQHRYKN